MGPGDDRAYARAPRPEDVARVCRALNAAAARYVLIGGFAAMAHGAVRTTQDIDRAKRTDRASDIADRQFLEALQRERP